MHSNIIKYIGAWICFELAYGLVFLVTHILANLIKQELVGGMSFVIPYVAAFFSGFVGVFVGLSVIDVLFKSVKPRLVILMYYVVIAVILMIVFMTVLIFGFSGKSQPSWVLLQTFISIVSAWYLTEKNSKFGDS